MDDATGREAKGAAAPSPSPAVSSDALRFARLARHLATHGTKSTAGQAIAHAAVEVVGCTSAAVIHVETDDRLRFEIPGAEPDPLIQTIAAIVAETGEGPAPEAFATSRVVHCEDVTTETRWPAWRERILDRTPVRAVLVFPLRLDGRTLGLMPLFDEHPGFFADDDTRALAEVYADHATIALSRVIATEQAGNLSRALDSNRSIGQALGILMARYTLREDDAFDVLRLASQATNRKIRDLASDVVREGDLPTDLRLRRPEARGA